MTLTNFEPLCVQRRCNSARGTLVMPRCAASERGDSGAVDADVAESVLAMVPVSLQFELDRICMCMCIYRERPLSRMRRQGTK